MTNFAKIFRSTTFLAIVATCLWATAFSVIKIGLQYHTPLQFAGFRFTMAGILVFVFFAKPRFFFQQVKQHWKFVLLISVLQVSGQYALFYSGLDLIPGSLGALIVGSSPLFVALVAHFHIRNDRLTPLKISSFIIGISGIAIITIGRQKMQFGNHLEWLGILLLLCNNILSGYSNVLVFKAKKKIHPLALSGSSLFIGGISLILISFPIEGIPNHSFPVSYYLSLGWLSFLSAAAVSIWFSLLSRPGTQVSTLNTWKFLIPVLGAVLSWILIPDEHPDILQIVAMAIIALALILLNSRK